MLGIPEDLFIPEIVTYLIIIIIKSSYVYFRRMEIIFGEV